MTTPNNARIADLGDTLTEGSTGFTPRKQSGISLFFHLFLLACTIMLAVAFLVFYLSPRGCVLAIIIGFCFALIAYNFETLKKEKSSIEFMSALFSSALGGDYAFCFIVKSTGDIVFYNRPFQAVFPDYVIQYNRTFSGLLNLYNVTQIDKTILNGFIESNKAGNTLVSFHGAKETESRTLTFYIEPIERPTGFFLVRGK